MAAQHEGAASRLVNSEHPKPELPEIGGTKPPYGSAMRATGYAGRRNGALRFGGVVIAAVGGLHLVGPLWWDGGDDRAVPAHRRREGGGAPVVAARLDEGVGAVRLAPLRDSGDAACYALCHEPPPTKRARAAGTRSARRGPSPRQRATPAASPEPLGDRPPTAP